MTQAICDITTDEVNVDVVVEPQADTMVEVANRAGGMEQVFHDNTLIGNGNSVDLGVNTEIIATKEYVDEKAALSIDTYTKDQIDGKFTAVDAQIDANADAIQKTREDYIQADSEIHQILNNHAENLTTLHNDVDDLGDQVAEIESKIPESASSTNQLATKADLANIDLDGYVKKSGDTMTGDLAFDVVAGGYTVAFHDSYANADTGNTDSVIKRIQSNHSVQGLIFSETKNGTVNMQFTMIADGFFMPHGNRLLGSADYPWENIYAKKLNNGADIAIPTTGGTMALKEDIEQAVNTQNLTVGSGEGTLYIGDVAGTATIATNNGLDIVAQTKFDTAPTTDDTTSWADANATSFVRKSQVAEVATTLKTNQDSLYDNQIELRDMLNAKDADGNWTTLTTTAQAAIPAINELNENKASNEELSGYLPLSGGTMTGSIIRVREDGDSSDPILRTYVSDNSYYISATSYGYYFSGAGVFFNGVRPHDVAGADLGTWVYKWRTVYATKISSGLDMDIEVPAKKGTMALVEDIDAIGGDGTAGQVLTKTDDGFTWQDAAGGGGGASLPDMTGNAGKFLTNDGATASWGEALVSKGNQWNNATIISPNGSLLNAGNLSIVIYGGSGWINTGINSVALCTGTAGDSSVSIIGTASARYAAQLGVGTNPDDNTFKVGNANGNFEMMSADGTIPAERMSATAGTTGQVLTKTDTGMAWADASGGDGDIDCGVMS